MSVKIHNGFILEGITSLEDALYFCHSIRKKFNIIANEIWAEQIIYHAVTAFDEYTFTQNPKGAESFIDSAYNFISDNERESMRTKLRSFTNVDMELSFFPVRINKSKRIIGMAFINNQAMRQEFFSLPRIKDYSYYDNSDRPENVSVKEWNNRQKTWMEKVFPDNDNMTISEKMMINKIVQEGDRILFIKQLEEFFAKKHPSFENRVIQLAHQLTVEEKNDKEPLKEYSDIINFLNSDEYKTNKEQLRLKAEKVLIKDLEFKNLQ